MGLINMFSKAPTAVAAFFFFFEIRMEAEVFIITWGHGGGGIDNKKVHFNNRRMILDH